MPGQPSPAKLRQALPARSARPVHAKPSKACQATPSQPKQPVYSPPGPLGPLSMLGRVAGAIGLHKSCTECTICHIVYDMVSEWYYQLGCMKGLDSRQMTCVFCIMGSVWFRTSRARYRSQAHPGPRPFPPMVQNKRLSGQKRPASAISDKDDSMSTVSDSGWSSDVFLVFCSHPPPPYTQSPRLPIPQRMWARCRPGQGDAHPGV